jgi:hypothetical protein
LAIIVKKLLNIFAALPNCQSTGGVSIEMAKPIYEKTQGRVKKQRAVFQRKNLCQNETSNLLGQHDKNFLGGLSSRIQFVV